MTKSPPEVFPDPKVGRFARTSSPLTLIRHALEGPFLDLRIAAVHVIATAIYSSDTFKECAARLGCKERALRQFRNDYPEVFKAAFMGWNPKKIRKIH